MCISEFIDISPTNLDSSLCFIQPVFFMMHSACKLNRRGNNIQPWHTPVPIWNQSIVPCPVLTVASWPAYRFLKRQVMWSDITISLRIFHSLFWSTQSKALAQEKEIQRSKMAVWGGLTNSCEKKGSEKQRRKGNIYPFIYPNIYFECRVPKNSKER